MNSILRRNIKSTLLARDVRRGLPPVAGRSTRASHVIHFGPNRVQTELQLLVSLSVQNNNLRLRRLVR
jgi:hypothetical protein